MKKILLISVAVLVFVIACTAIAAEETVSYVPIKISDSFNNNGIASEENYIGDLAGGYAYPAELWPQVKKSGIIVAGVPFLLADKTEETNNNISCNGDEIKFTPGNYSAILILGASVYAATPLEENISLNYTGSTDDVILSLTDWCQEPQAGEKIAFTFAYRLSCNANMREDIPNYIFMQTIQIDSKRKLASITLSENVNMHIFAITLKK